jgi:hypothetical protein
MHLFRVFCDGPQARSDSERAAIERLDLGWEGNGPALDATSCRHAFLITAPTAAEAVHAVARVLRSQGFARFEATEIAPGLRQEHDAIDWNVAKLSDLSALHQVILTALLNAGEPTWILLEDPDIPDDCEVLRSALQDLEQRGLVGHVRELAARPDSSLDQTDDWWYITDQGWDVLGVRKRAFYH